MKFYKILVEFKNIVYIKCFTFKLKFIANFNSLYTIKMYQIYNTKCVAFLQCSFKYLKIF